MAIALNGYSALVRIILIKGHAVHDPVHEAYGQGRMTDQRRSVALAAAAMPGAFTVDELAEEVRDAFAASIATATVYRAVAAMEAAGSLERVGVREGAALYVYCGAKGHHHHVVCDSCGRVAETTCPIDVAAVSTDGFVVTRHEVTLYGLCPACASSKADGPDRDTVDTGER